MYMGVCTNHQKAIKYCATNVVLTLALIQIIKTRLVFRILFCTNILTYISRLSTRQVSFCSPWLSRGNVQVSTVYLGKLVKERNTMTQ